MIDGACPICQTPLVPGQDPCPSCGAARGPGTLTRNLPAGHALQQGKFTVGRVLGEGGFGITYKGAHRDLGHPVAIKEYVPAHAQRVGTSISVPAQQQEAFVREREGLLKEAQLLFGLRAPGIVQVHDAFQENGTAYIVMEYLEGRTLEARIQQEGRISADEVQRLAQALGQALEAVHAQHLLHRDIKPANIMLTTEGRIVLIDFGSARAFQRNLTQRHTRLVTPGYAAPEQYSEEARFGPYTDIFSLGATLYHALKGTPPPPAIDRLQSGRALSLPAGMPAPLATAVQQALELRIDDRPASVTAFLNLMQRPPSTGSATPSIASAPLAGSRVLSDSFPASWLDNDREALMALYQATNGAQWRSRTAWLSASPVGTWFGVNVDKAGRVIGLGLANNQLSGPIPPALGQLTCLENLNLHSNQLSGPIPPALGQLTCLKYLFLDGNQLSGPIPPALGQLTCLENLFLDGNQLSGAIPPALGQLTCLEWLTLRGNQLSGTIPAKLGQLTCLKYLFLDGNRLSGTIPAELGQLANLRELLLSDNRLSGAIPAKLGRLTKLTLLGLRRNQLSGAIPPELGQLTNLQGLFLSDNRLSGAIPPELGQLTNLQQMTLDGNSSLGKVPSTLFARTREGDRYVYRAKQHQGGCATFLMTFLTGLLVLSLGGM